MSPVSPGCKVGYFKYVVLQNDEDKGRFPIHHMGQTCGLGPFTFTWKMEKPFLKCYII